MSQTNNYELIISEFNQRVINTHHAHYIDGKNELIDTSATASPNGNQIYHLYSNGEITYQKGAWAYLRRSEFNLNYNISGARDLPFKFVKDAADGTSYAILTKEECVYFREEMMNIIKEINKK